MLHFKTECWVIPYFGLFRAPFFVVVLMNKKWFVFYANCMSK